MEQKTFKLNWDHHSVLSDLPIKADADTVYRVVEDRYNDIVATLGLTLWRYGLLQEVEECLKLARELYKKTEDEVRAKFAEDCKNDSDLLTESLDSRGSWWLVHRDVVRAFDAAVMYEGGTIARTLSDGWVQGRKDGMCLTTELKKSGVIELASMWVSFKTKIDLGAFDAVDKMELLLDFMSDVDICTVNSALPNRQGRPSIEKDKRKRRCCTDALNDCIERNGGKLPTERGWKSDLYADIAYRWNTQFKRADEAEVRPDAASKWMDVFFPEL